MHAIVYSQKILYDNTPGEVGMHILLLIMLTTVFFTGCASQQFEDGNDMDVTAVIRSIHRCSRISPEIEVYNAPLETARFDVTLEDRSDPSRIHGGGSWPNDGSGSIPEGALTRHYMGACPPANTSRSYQYVVKAIDVNNKVLVIRNYIFEQE